MPEAAWLLLYYKVYIDTNLINVALKWIYCTNVYITINVRNVLVQSITYKEMADNVRGLQKSLANTY